MSNPLSLVTVNDDVLLTIAEARGLRAAGREDEAFAIMESRLKVLAELLTVPEEAAIGDLVAMIADAQEVSEADVYLKLRQWTQSPEVEREGE